MLKRVKPLYKEFKLYFALWHQVDLATQKGQIEIAVTGPDAIQNAHKLQNYYMPFTTFSGGNSENLIQLKGKIKAEKKCSP